MKKDCWKRLGRAAVGVLALLVCPAASQAGDGVVALQSADPACSNDSGDLFVSCANGTVTHTPTGLVWVQELSCAPQVNWREAMEFVAGLSDLDQGLCTARGLTPEECDCNLTDGSSPGEWRLPSVDELQVMVSDAVGIVPLLRYWSASPFVTLPDSAWGMDLSVGFFIVDPKTREHYLWPVRGGQ